MKARHLLIAFVCFSLLSLVGCVQQIARSTASKSVSRMIEPVKDSQKITKKTPLTFPVSVAIVTVPGEPNLGQLPHTTLRQAAGNLRQQLLTHSKYVGTVTVVEQNDFGDTISLGKIGTLYGADIAIILSHQQDQRGGQSGFFALMDATGVGAFLVPGVEIKTTSVIEGKLIHIPSNAIIFRASGTDQRSSHATSYAHNKSLTEESIKSILAATTNFGDELGRTLTRFDEFDLSKAVPVSVLETEEAAPANDSWRKVDTYKRTGGGAFGIIPLLICAATCCAAWRRK